MGHIMSIPKTYLLTQDYSYSYKNIPLSLVYTLLKYGEMESLSKTENNSIYKGGGWWVKIMDHYYSLKCLYFSQYSLLKNLI